MHNFTKIGFAIGAAAFAWDMNVGRRCRKHIKQGQQRNAELAEENIRLTLQILYLMNLLDHNGVPATEFDKIALRSMMQKD
jgi:hypothetical protein